MLRSGVRGATYYDTDSRSFLLLYLMTCSGSSYRMRYLPPRTYDMKWFLGCKVQYPGRAMHAIHDDYGDSAVHVRSPP